MSTPIRATITIHNVRHMSAVVVGMNESLNLGSSYLAARLRRAASVCDRCDIGPSDSSERCAIACELALSAGARTCVSQPPPPHSLLAAVLLLLQEARRLDACS